MVLGSWLMDLGLGENSKLKEQWLISVHFYVMPYGSFLSLDKSLLSWVGFVVSHIVTNKFHKKLRGFLH